VSPPQPVAQGAPRIQKSPNVRNAKTKAAAAKAKAKAKAKAAAVKVKAQAQAKAKAAAAKAKAKNLAEEKRRVDGLLRRYKADVKGLYWVRQRKTSKREARWVKVPHAKALKDYLGFCCRWVYNHWGEPDVLSTLDRELYFVQKTYEKEAAVYVFSLSAQRIVARMLEDKLPRKAFGGNVGRFFERPT